MPIRPTTLERHGRKSLVVMGSDQTLDDALARLGELGYQENDAYLVVDRGDGQYQVALFLDMHLVVARLGYDSFTLPLRALPIPFADRVVPTNTPESGGEIVRWANRTPQSAVVVVEAGQVAGLFASRHRSASDAVFQPTSLLELHGHLAQLHDDPRAAFEARVAAPNCPHCGAKGFYRFDPRQRVYACQSCGHVVDQR
jgi:hypothetical protein